MYEKLLISAGGGIVSRDQQAEQANCATIAIGLGGTGISCLRALKREVYNRVKPDPGDAFVPRYSHIKFLAVDTDRSPDQLGKRGRVDSIDVGTEFFDISYPDIQGLLSDDHNLQQDPTLRWLKTAGAQGDGSGIKIMNATAGAGGVRQIGRLLLLQNCRNFVAKLASVIEEAQRGLVDADINIHIFTGISGGTGAGTFLDVCYILQHVLESKGIAGKAFVSGFFFLPDVNSTKYDADYLPLNGFAAMKELDYAMNYETNGGSWEQQYAGFTVSTQMPPVKLAHLVSAKDSGGNILEDGYNYAMNVVVDYVMEFIISNDAAENEADTEAFSLQSHINNVYRLIATVDKTAGATYNYCVLGAANTYMPYKDILTYLASRIFEGFKNLNQQIPVDSVVAEFVKRNGLQYTDILAELKKGSKNIPMLEVDHNQLYDAVQGQDNTSTPGLLNKMVETRDAIRGVFQKNQKALLDTKSANGIVAGSAQEVSLLVRVKKALCDLAVDPAKGPYFAAALLSSTNNRDLINHIDGHLEENTKHLDQAHRNMSLRWETRGKALEALQKSSNAPLVGNRKSRAQDYVKACHAWFTEEVKISQYEYMRDLLTELKKQLTTLSDSFFRIFAGMMSELQETFAENLNTLSNPVAHVVSYAEPLMTIQDEDQRLKNTLDRAVEEMKIDDQIKRFVEAMLNNPDAWVTQDSNRISAVVNDYFLGVLDEYSRRSLLYYLQEKFNTKIPDKLKSHVYDEIIVRLGKKSAPMFWSDDKRLLAAAKPMGYLSFPNISDAIKGAAQDYVSNHRQDKIKERVSWSTDRISIFRFICGLPLFGYKGVSNYLSVYMEGSRNTDMVGFHLYEGSNRDPRNNIALIDVIPASRIDEAEMNEGMRTAIQDYDKAVDLKIISTLERDNVVEYHLNRFDAATIDQWTDELKKVIASGRAAVIKAAVAHAQEQIANLPVESYRLISNNGAAGYKELVVRDHVVDSLEHMKTLREQLAIVEAYSNAIDAASKGSDKEAKYRADVKAFTEALETGVIRIENPYTYSYVTVSYGIEDKVELTTIEQLPYGQAIPPYSAFEAFLALDDGVKAEIAAGVRDVLVNQSETISETLAGVQAALPANRINAWVSIAKTNFPDNAAAIAQFFQLMNAELTTFSAMHS